MEQAYLGHYIVAGIVLVILGTVTHVLRALVNLYPDRLSDKPWMDMAVSDGYSFGDRVFGTEYDDGGFYKLDSLRNWRNMVVAMLLSGWAMMLLAPGVSGLVASAINMAFAWLWDLFFYRLETIRIY